MTCGWAAGLQGGGGAVSDWQPPKQTELRSRITKPGTHIRYIPDELISSAAPGRSSGGKHQGQHQKDGSAINKAKRMCEPGIAFLTVYTGLQRPNNAHRRPTH
ncbi:hypothetical protein E2C01_056163 [Portunus trituberculatus]|uniref:Uncharacterized protein n=1 Tax=Portunus trituberculatus TaxID=210409 RepID=A0A5B7GTC1_PORTR|nr:hypothetical protein [Portunus trituberculatus]